MLGVGILGTIYVEWGIFSPLVFYVLQILCKDYLIAASWREVQEISNRWDQQDAEDIGYTEEEGS